jgi:hypothetical protein
MRVHVLAMMFAAASVSGLSINGNDRLANANPSHHPAPATLEAPSVVATEQHAAGHEPMTAQNEGKEVKRRDTRSQECPDGMVLAHGQRCDLFEQVCVRWEDPEGRPSRRVCGAFRAPSQCVGQRRAMRFCIDRDEHVELGSGLPMVGVSWETAAATCAGEGKRLCTGAEWEFACEGEEGLPYPYGHERSRSLCNQDRVVRDGEKGVRGDVREPAHPSCVSPFGVRDMVGNVDEWVSRPHEASPNRSELRGGWWMTGRNRCRAATTSHDERYAGRQTGFRCCRNAEPSGPMAGK